METERLPWLLLELGCAECGDWPLVVPRGFFPSAKDAVASLDVDEVWYAHPSGGFYAQWGSGGAWVTTVDALSQVSVISDTYSDHGERVAP